MRWTGKMPWWLIIVTGVLILGVGIFLLAGNDKVPDKSAALKSLVFIVSILVLAYGIFNFYKAYKFRGNKRLMAAHLVHGILDAILFILLRIITPSPVLLGVILGCWFVVFGFFGLMQIDQNSDKNRQLRRLNMLLLLIGLVVLAVSILLSKSNHFISFLGVVILAIGLLRIAQGLITKNRYDGRTSGGRSNLY